MTVNQVKDILLSLSLENALSAVSLTAVEWPEFSDGLPEAIGIEIDDDGDDEDDEGDDDGDDEDDEDD